MSHYLEHDDQPVGPSLFLHGQKKRFYVPQGIEKLLEEMTTEVLKYNPDNIYKFLADLCDAKISNNNAKDKDRRHSWEWRAWSSDGSSLLDDDELITFVSQFHIPIEAAEHLATVIQAVYRGFQARKDVKKLLAEKTRRRSSLWEEWVKEGNFIFEGNDINEILLQYGISLPEANKAATKIQAMFRGYFTRKRISNNTPILTNLKDTKEEDVTQEHEQAAVTIQKYYRGYKTRQELQEKAQDLIDNQGRRVAAQSLEKEYADYKRESTIVNPVIPSETEDSDENEEEEDEEEPLTESQLQELKKYHDVLFNRDEPEPTQPTIDTTVIPGEATTSISADINTSSDVEVAEGRHKDNAFENEQEGEALNGEIETVLDEQYEEEDLNGENKIETTQGEFDTEATDEEHEAEAEGEGEDEAVEEEDDTIIL